MQTIVNPVAPGAAVGVSEDMIHHLVRTFYARVREDEVLGPIFNRVVGDWDEHLNKLCAFWSSVVLMTGRYKDAPMQAHAALTEISIAHFERWLMVFRLTAAEVCPPQAAALFIDRAERIAQSLERGIAIHRNHLMGNQEFLTGGRGGS